MFAFLSYELRHCSFTELCNVHANREAHKAWIQSILIEAAGEFHQLLRTRQVKLAACEPHASADDLVSANFKHSSNSH